METKFCSEEKKKGDDKQSLPTSIFMAVYFSQTTYCMLAALSWNQTPKTNGVYNNVTVIWGLKCRKQDGLALSSSLVSFATGQWAGPERPLRESLLVVIRQALLGVYLANSDGWLKSTFVDKDANTSCNGVLYCSPKVLFLFVVTTKEDRFVNSCIPFSYIKP